VFETAAVQELHTNATVIGEKTHCEHLQDIISQGQQEKQVNAGGLQGRITARVDAQMLYIYMYTRARAHTHTRARTHTHTHNGQHTAQ
jgi:hypothetical protein